MVTTYEYGDNGNANNLRVKGTVVSADGTNLRSCFRYDNQGNRISETRPRVRLSLIYRLVHRRGLYQRSLSIDIGDGRSVTIGKSVLFNVGSSGDSSSTSKIKGIEADVGITARVTKVQAVEGGIDVTGAKGFISQTRHIPLKD